MMEYEFQRGAHNVHYLTAPYALLVKVLGGDGTDEPMDEEKVQAQWIGHNWAWEVYDYCSAVPKEQVTEWHVQGSEAGIQHLLEKLKEGS